MLPVQESGSGEPGGIQFDTVEYAEGSKPFDCASCARPVSGEYYEAGGKYICPSCRDELSSPPQMRHLLGASGLGLIAALIGGAVWFGVRRLTGYEIGLIAIVVGLMVGLAVRAGAKGRGGPRFQALAVFLTYTGIALNYAPDILSSFMEGARDSDATPAASASASPGQPEATAAGPSVPSDTQEDQEIGIGRALTALVMLVGLVIALSYAAPFLAGFENVLGLLIIGFALFEAWRINRQVPVQGPFRTVAPAAVQESVG
jgi:hypothetical protein